MPDNYVVVVAAAVAVTAADGALVATQSVFCLAPSRFGRSLAPLMVSPSSLPGHAARRDQFKI